MAEASPVRGCMIIKPWGYGIWELLQRQLDDRIKAFGFNPAFPRWSNLQLTFCAGSAMEIRDIALA
jgi:prolyl-tRNA synthetase